MILHFEHRRSPRLLWRRTFVMAPLACLTTLVSGCRAPETLSDPGTLKLMSANDHRAITPLWNSEEQHLVFLNLFHGGHPGVGGEDGVPAGVEGRLAKRWERTPDGRTWTYHLRTDVRWHDGVPVTAWDIEFTWALWEHPTVLRAAPGDQTLTVLDDSTFTVTYKRPGRAVPTSYTYLPRHLLKDLNPEKIDEWEFWDHPVGNGPYRYVRHEPGVFVELEANPDYYLGKPEIDRVILKLGGGNSVVELRAGNVDIVNFSESSALAAELDRDSRFRAVYSVRPRALGILWNQNNPLFQDVRVREALSLGVDRRELARAAFIPDEMSVTDVPVNESQRMTGDYPDPLPYDPDRARRLLAEAGWTDRDGDGWIDRDGVPFRFELLPWGFPDALVLLQAQYRRLGIQMELAQVSTDVFDTRFPEGSWDAALYQPFAHPLRYFDAGFRGIADGTPVETPDFGYENPELTRLARLWQSSFTADGDSLSRRFSEIMREDFPITGLISLVRVQVVHSRLRARDDQFGPGHAFEMWIDEDWEAGLPSNDQGGGR